MKPLSLRWSAVVFGILLLASVARTDDLEDEDEDDDVAVDDDVDAEPPKLKKREAPVYKAPMATGNTYLADFIESEDNFLARWVTSKARKDGAEEAVSKYDGVWQVEEPENNPLKGDLGLVLKSQAKHHAVSVELDRPFEFNGKPFIVQYEVKFQNGQECGGAYIKLLTKSNRLDLEQVNDKTPYTIMFGPDKCGNDNKLHFIFRHKNELSGNVEEKHAKKPTANIDSYFSDKKTHLYTLVVNPDNSYEVLVDQVPINVGNLLEDMQPPVNPAKQIVDPEDKKPADWDDKEKIPDPEAKKPEDWDEAAPEMIEDAAAEKPSDWLDEEEELIADPEAERPSDWDEDMDGEWEAAKITNPKCEAAPGCGAWTRPSIKNPAYKGKWKAPMISNPDYQGKWTARMIDNPDYYEDLNPYKMQPIAALSLELWSMSSDILFDNFLVTDDRSVADQWAADSWYIKQGEEANSGLSGRSVVQAVMDATEERPWLWAVFVVVILLPIVLIIAYCCMPSKTTDTAADRKKTDEVVADVKEENEENEEKEKEEKEKEEGSEEGAQEGDAGPVGPEGDEGASTRSPKKATKSKKAKKSDLNTETTGSPDGAEAATATPSESAGSVSPRRRARLQKD